MKWQVMFVLIVAWLLLGIAPIALADRALPPQPAQVAPTEPQSISAARPGDRQAPRTPTLDRTGPTAVSATFVVTTTASSGPGSLRQAILDANATPGADLITFALPGDPPFVIQPTFPLPAITDTVTLDGSSQAGYTGAPVVMLDGLYAGTGAIGLQVRASNSIIRGLAIVRFKWDGVHLNGPGGNTVAGNYIGVGTDGVTALGNENLGLSIWESPNNLVGGATADARNVVSANGSDGVMIYGTNAISNIVQNNIIGADVHGTSALGNARDGVLVYSATNTLIADNVIAGNGAAEDRAAGVVYAGIWIQQSTATGNVLRGNRIGVNADGTAALPNTGDGVVIGFGAHDNVVGGTDAAARNVIAGNTRNGVRLIGSGATSNTVQGNLIGLGADGATALGNQVNGIFVHAGAANNVIGGAASGARNIISGNGWHGLALTTDGNRVQNNIFGADASGTSERGNMIVGVWISSTGNLIGGAGAGNLISGNYGNAGIYIRDATAADNVIQGNRIGTNISGTEALGNGGDGIYIGGGAINSLIGGTSAGEGNLISGNAQDGLRFQDTGTLSHTVQGNLIGVDATGTARLGNGEYGLGVESGAAYNTIGGAAASAGNVIAGNGTGGVLLSNTQGNLVQGNHIGTDAGDTLDLGNRSNGIYLANTASDNLIGGTSSDAGNVIAFNTGAGVSVNNGSGNGILGNAIRANGGLGISLDPATHANNSQPAPALTSLTHSTSPNGITITGTLSGLPTTTHRIEFFSNAACDASGAGEGQTLIGATSVTTTARGEATFAAAFTTTVPTDHYLTSTATDPNNNTSEFSSCLRENVWTGALDSDWNTAGNWANNAIPDSTSVVVIPDVAHDPVIGAAGGASYHLDLRAGAALTLAKGATLRVSGDWKNNGAFNALTGTVGLDGLRAQAVGGANTFYDLAILKAGGSVDATGGALTVNNTLSVISGVLTTSASLNHVQIAPGAALAASGNLSVQGDWHNDGTFAPGTYTVTFNGASQRLEGALIFNHVGIANDSVANDGKLGSVLAAADLQANGNLSIAAGAALDVGERNLSVSGVLSNAGHLRQIKTVAGSSDTGLASTGSYGGLALNPQGNNLGRTDAIFRGQQPCDTNDSSVRRCFYIMPETRAASNVTFYFANGELNGNACTDLQAFAWSGSDWQTAGTVSGQQCSTEPYAISVTSVITWGTFALRSGGAPTGAPNTADLRLTKTGASSLWLGDALTYTLAITNNGPQTATGVALTDTLPAAVTLLSATPSQGTCGGTSVVACSIGTLDVGASASVIVAVRPTSAGVLTNHAAARANEIPLNPSNTAASWSTTVTARADLSLNATAVPEPAQGGDVLTYTFTLTNAGPDPATNVVLTDMLPAGVIFNSASASQGNCQSTSSLLCSLGTLDIGGSAAVRLVVIPTQAGAFTNTASVSAAEVDPTPEDRAQTITTTVIAPHLEIAKIGPSSARPGQPITYTLTVVNSGTRDATNLIISDTLPSGATYVLGGARRGYVVRWTLPSLAAGGGVHLFEFTVTAQDTIVNNQYSVTADEYASATGQAPVVTQVRDAWRLYLPLVMKE